MAYACCREGGKEGGREGGREGRRAPRIRKQIRGSCFGSLLAAPGRAGRKLPPSDKLVDSSQTIFVNKIIVTHGYQSIFMAL